MANLSDRFYKQGAPLWEDVRVSLGVANPSVPGPSNLTYAEYNATSGAYAWYFDNVDGGTVAGLSFEAQLPHGYKPGTNIRPHLHWGRTAAGTGNVRWEVGFTIIKNDGAAAAHIAKFTTDAVIPDQNYTSITPFTEINGTTYNLVESDIILCWLRRDNTIGTNFADNAWIFSFDYHYQAEKDGSVNYSPPFM